MKILFSVGSFGFLRNFEPALRQLAARGNDLHLVADRKDSVGGTKTLDLLLRDYPDRIRYSYAPSRKDSRWQPLATQLRLTLDYWRYLDPRYDHSPSLRARGASQAPPFASRLVRWPPMRSRPVLGALRALVRMLERAVPHGHRIEAFLRAERPDLFLVTPLLYFGSQQVDYVRAAKALGIRTVLGVGSWDHLTTKGLIHEQPDRVIVWNEAQREEARELHGVPPDRVIVTGAQAYDHWFVQTPALPREAFCAKVGVPRDRPLLLYLCSSPFITPHEVPFVRRWIESIRAASDPVLRRAAILIRPHPQNADQWQDFNPSEYEAVGIWPRGGANPVDTEARADYFDSMFYSVAVVGVNTSALIESGIVGRPVYTVLADDFSGQQEGTLHFQHLKNVNGGLLTTAASMPEHLAQLAEAVRRQPARDEKARAFVETFVRPYGFDVPAADRFVEAIESYAAAPAPVARRGGLTDALVRRAMLPLALLTSAAARTRRAEKRTPRAAGRLQIMFVLASPEYLRYYDSTMRLLAERGHHVSVAVNWLRERKAARLDGLSGDEGIDVIGVVPKRMDMWTPMARAVRGTFDFARYLHPRLAAAPALRARMKRKVLPAWLRGLDRIESLGDRGLNRFYRVLRGFERAIPASRRILDFLAAHRPDVVVVSPLVDAASDQVDVVRASQAMGIPVVAAIASWDNLTNKGHMRVRPDLVTVWNEHQKAEAVAYHGVDADRVVVTGAQLFDRWFDRQPSQSREAFCRMVGVPADRPIVLYTGSSVFIAKSEVEAPFVRRWIAALRESGDATLRDAAILIRPHPFNCEAWETADFSDLGPVSVWPRQRYTPAAEEARNSLFDSLFYSAAVVGVNTSAMVEAAILGRPVLSVLAPEFAATQEGTVHFHYLLPENGGFLRVAQSIEEHVDQLSEVLQTPELTRQQTARFVGSFIRPHGLETACTPILADTLERAARLSPPPVRDTASTRAARVAAWPLAIVLRWMALGEKGRAARDAWNALVRASRIALKRVIVRPALLTVWLARVAGGRVRRGSRRVARWATTMAGRLLRRARHARYQLAVRTREMRAPAPAPATRVADTAGPPAPLRILFSMRNFWYVRIFESVIRALAARGHSIHILAEHDPDPVPQWTDAAMALAGDCPNVTIGYARRSIDDEWLDLRVMVRLGRDYLRFLRPQYAATPILAKRARERVPAAIVALAERGTMTRAALDRVLRAAEGAIPEDPEIAAAVAAERPDLVLVTPLLDLGSDQHDVVRTARVLDVPAALCVGSWDHLSSKALIRDAPDRVFVWNATQKQEAVDLHHVPGDRVVVTGAQCFDDWFDRRPALPRDEFCRKVGLDPSRPYILYVCSALFEGSPNEAEFAARWISAVRASHDPALRDAGILIRPHPKRGFEWDGVDLAAFPNVSLWPPRAAAPMDTVTRADYFDSMYHSASVVGLNTSALIEAGIVGRRVHTILIPEFNENQEGTLHFHYLIEGGLLRISRDMGAHIAQLEESLRASGEADHPNRAFIESFVRPQGLTVPATPLFVEAIEQLAALNPARSQAPLWVSPLRAVMAPLARRTLGTFAEHESRERRYRDKQQAREERMTALETQRAAEKARIVEEPRRRHETIRRERQAQAERDRDARLSSRQREREEKEQKKTERISQWQREKRRHAFNARLVAYYRRLVKPFSASR